jgi:hypothetical protein
MMFTRLRLGRRRIFSLIAISILGVARFAMGADSGVPVEEAVAKDLAEWRELLRQKDYDQLDHVADELRATKGKYRNGYGRLWRFTWLGLNPNPQEMSNENYQTAIQSLEDWLKAKPQSANARLALANTWLKFAYRARLDGGGTESPEERAKVLAERNGKAALILDEVPALKGGVDNVYRRLRIELSKCSGEKPDVNLVYDGLEEDPTNRELVHGMALMLLPRWYGEEGELEQFASEVASRTKDHSGDFQYMVAACATKELLKSYLLDTHAFSWPRIQQGFRDLERLFPESREHLSDEAQLAFMADDLDAVYRALKRLGDDPADPSWGYVEIPFDGFRKRMTPEMMQGDQKRLLLGHASPVMIAAPLGEGSTAASVDWQWGVRMHDFKSGKRQGWMWIRGMNVDSLSIQRRMGLLASGSDDAAGVMIQSLASGRGGGLATSKSKTRRTAFSPDGNLLAAADESGMIAVIDLKTGQTKNEIKAEQKREITGLAFSSDAAKIAASCASGEVLIFDLAGGRLDSTYRVGERKLTCVSWSDSHLATGSEGGEVHVLDPANGAATATWKADGGDVAALAFSPDGQRLAIGLSSGDWDARIESPLQLWSFSKDKAPTPLRGHKLGVNTVQFVDGVTLLSGSHDWTVRVWDVP